MGKTNDEIKKGLECCQLAFGFRECGRRCPYYRDSCCGALLAADALALIQQLEAQNAELLEEVEQLKAERDTLISDLEQYDELPCALCKHFSKSNDEIPCKLCKNIGTPTDEDKVSHWEWRGVQKEE